MGHDQHTPRDTSNEIGGDAEALAELGDDAFCTVLSRAWNEPFTSQKRLDALEDILLNSLSSQGSERATLTRVFKKYDANQDGILQLDECAAGRLERGGPKSARRPHRSSAAGRFERFVAAFGVTASVATPEELKALFDRYDLDDSGGLVFSEFSAAMLKRTEVYRPK